MNDATTARFWSKVRTSATCWEWTASKRAKGYGAFVWAGPSGEVVQGRAHRYSWMLHRGAIPAGACVLHTCDNPACVNPEHLWLGSKADNNRDMCMKGRHVSGGTHCGRGNYKIGEQHHNAKLTSDAVNKLREDRKAGLSFSQLAKKYGIALSTAFRTAKGISWTQD